MPRVSISSLPDHARVWIFAAERPLDGEARDRLLADVDTFLDQWAAHGTPLTCARDLVHDRFLMVAVDEQAAGVSGCSIDALTRRLRAHEQALGLALLDNGPVHYRADGEVARVSRAQFGGLADAGAVTPDTIVFDNTVQSLAAVRAGKWETPAKHAWHGQAFFR